MAGFNFAQNIIGLKNAGGGGGGGNSKHHYSTEEQIVGKWVDGKDLYEKTYVFNISDLVNGTISSSLMDGQFTIDNLNYDMIEIADGFMLNKGNTSTIKSNSLNYPNGNDYIRTNIQYETSLAHYIIYCKITYAVGGFYDDRENLSFVFVLRYTKTETEETEE